MHGLPKVVRVPKGLSLRFRIPNYAAYVESTLKDCGRLNLRLVEDETLQFPTPLSFEFGIGSAIGVVDTNDMAEIPPCSGSYEYWWKFHRCSVHEPFTNIRSFPPTSFVNWDQYRDLASDIRYTASSETILSTQRPKFAIRAPEWISGLTRRRSMVLQMLAKEYPDTISSEFTDQSTYWKRAGECLVSVHVPGMWNNMLDRAQHQLWGFGVCTISPFIFTTLLSEQPIPDVHYIQCRDDYSDLVSKIEWCRENRKACIDVGIEAKRLFQRNSLPEKIWSHIFREMKYGTV